MIYFIEHVYWPYFAMKIYIDDFFFKMIMFLGLITMPNNSSGFGLFFFKRVLVPSLRSANMQTSNILNKMANKIT